MLLKWTVQYKTGEVTVGKNATAIASMADGHTIRITGYDLIKELEAPYVIFIDTLKISSLELQSQLKTK